MSWLFWQAGSSPYVGGGFGHFYAFAPEPMEYPINYFTLEVKRQLSVLDEHLAENTYLCGDDYSIADMAVDLVRAFGVGASVRIGWFFAGERLSAPATLGETHRRTPCGG